MGGGTDTRTRDSIRVGLAGEPRSGQGLEREDGREGPSAGSTHTLMLMSFSVMSVTLLCAIFAAFAGTMPCQACADKGRGKSEGKRWTVYTGEQRLRITLALTLTLPARTTQDQNKPATCFYDLSHMLPCDEAWTTRQKVQGPPSWIVCMAPCRYTCEG